MMVLVTVAERGAPGALWYLFLAAVALLLVWRWMRLDRHAAEKESRRREREHEYAQRHAQQQLKPYDWREGGV